MANLFLLLVAVVFFMTGCSSVDMYTFRQDRVDQKLTGNEGYIAGTNNEPLKERKRKRTLFAIDFEGKAGENEADVEEIAPAEPVKDIEEEAPVPSKAPEKVETKKIEPEEEWLK
ncbi:secreted protein [Candidatus Omnitrophus magneticus]|uniref:Secreted protein n=1 Tax=Candidatus Omnitrophus magneticus TaxID=1609969 RepID=A0A0F0CRW7_9BACT|nr:secreted protein [Candidatus Omnitrophus magneticus]